MNNIAGIHYNKGEYDQALELYNQSLAIKKEIGDQQGIARTLNNIALIDDRKEEYEKALYSLIPAYEILKRQDTPELKRSIDMMSTTKDKLGKNNFDSLEENLRRKINNTD